MILAVLRVLLIGEYLAKAQRREGNKSLELSVLDGLVRVHPNLPLGSLGASTVKIRVESLVDLELRCQPV